MKNLLSEFSLLLSIIIFYRFFVRVSGTLSNKLIPENSEKAKEHRKLINPISYAHSHVDLFYLAALEEGLYSIVKEFAQKIPGKKPRFIKRYIADYEDSSLKAYTSFESAKEKIDSRIKIYSHPFLKHRMIWRFSKYFHKIKTAINASTDLELKEELKKVFDEDFQCPNEKDLNNSKQSLTVIHDVYNIPIENFASGNFSFFLTNVSLSAIQCHEMAKFAFDEKKYIFAIDWIVTADAKNLNPDRHPILDKINEQALRKLLDAVIAEHDSNWQPKRTLEVDDDLYFFQTKIESDSDSALVTQKSVYQKRFKKKGTGQSDYFFSERAAFYHLCQGKNLQSEKEKSQLSCWYETKSNPYWFINPQKMELHNQEPYIFQVYDFLGKNLVWKLKNDTAHNLVRAGVSHPHSVAEEFEGDEEKMRYHSIRTSTYHWIHENNFYPLKKLNERIGLLTSLIATSTYLATTFLQIANYAVGGQFYFHVDALQGSVEEDDEVFNTFGDRIATFMIYLNNVERGGNTVFTSAGVSVTPVEGSAVFWYNLKRNGDIDHHTWHGGCPVILGTKWVANKWIHSNVNTFMRKCSLKKEE